MPIFIKRKVIFSQRFRQEIILNGIMPLLAKKEPFDLKKYGDVLAKHRGWTSETVDFMSQVFFELNFVTMDNGLISLNKNINKRDLTDSDTYQQKQAQLKLEKDLLYSSFQAVKGLV